MKKLYKYIPIVAAMLAMISCSQEEEFFAPQNGKDTPITIASVGVDDAVVTRSYTVDEVTNEMLTATAAISLYVSSDKGGNYAVNDMRLRLTDGEWGPSDANAKVLYEGQGSTQKFAAIYPQQRANLANPWISYDNIPFAPKSDYEFSMQDYLYCYGDVTNPSLRIAFKHVFAKLSFNVTYGSELDKTTSAISTLTVTELPKSMKINIFTGEYDITGMAFTGESKFPNAAYLHGLMLPYTQETEPLTYGIRVETKDSRFFTTTFQPCRKDASDNIINYGFQSGYAYTVNLKVGKDKITVTSIETDENNPWGDGWDNETEL